MKHSELTDMDLLSLSELVQQGEVTPAELVETSIDAIEASNRSINAVITKTYESARSDAAGPQKDTVFGGLPFLVKDLYCHMAGVPTSGGSVLTREFIPDHDSELMARYRRAGLIPLGKTNVCEFGTLGTTEPKLFGPTRNPWDVNHSSGGSSGGSAAAVASGMVKAAHGGDGAGSIRIPASCCGLFGLKPTRGRISLGPDIGEGLGGIVNEHVLTVTVRDSAALLDATKGNAPGDPYAAPCDTASYLGLCSSKPRRLKIAVSDTSMFGTNVDPECVSAVHQTAKLCEDLGHTVVFGSPEVDWETYYGKYLNLWSLTATRALCVIAAREGRPADDVAVQSEAFNQYLYAVGRRISATDFLQDMSWFHRFSRNLAHFQQEYDVWLTPTLGTQPPKLGHFDAEVHGGSKVMERFMEFLAFTTFANMAGTPAVSVPLYWTAQGLPVGSQFNARFGDEATLFQLAVQLERAAPWRHRRPDPVA